MSGHLSRCWLFSSWMTPAVCFFNHKWIEACCESTEQEQNNNSDTGRLHTPRGKAWVKWKLLSKCKASTKPLYTVLEVQKASNLLWNVNHTPWDELFCWVSSHSLKFLWFFIFCCCFVGFFYIIIYMQYSLPSFEHSNFLEDWRSPVLPNAAQQEFIHWLDMF